MCMSAKAAAIESAGRRKGSDNRTVLVKHCPSPERLFSRSKQTRRSVGEETTATPLKQEYIEILFFSAPVQGS